MVLSQMNLSALWRKVLRRCPWTRERMVRVVAGALKGKKVIVGLGDDYLLGTYETDTVDEAKVRIRPTDVVFDLGANAGYLTMVFAACGSHVFAFEPMKQNIERWRRHISVNGVRNASLLPLAVCDSDRTVFFAEGHSVFSNRYERTPKNDDGQRVEGRSIDSLVADGTVPPPQVIKIDVEGAEFDVICGARTTISKYHPLIFLATHDCHKPGIRDECLAQLEEIGYSCTQTSEEKIIPGLADFICTPKKLD